MSESRDDALQEVVALIKGHGIALKDIESALNVPDSGTKIQAGISSKIFTYLGGLFVLAGLAVAMNMFWPQMNSAMRIIITLGSGVVCHILAITLAKRDGKEKAVEALFFLGALLQPSGLCIAIIELSAIPGDWRYAALAVTAVMTAQQLLAFLALRRVSVPLFFAIAFAATALSLAADLSGMNDDLIFLAAGFFLLCAAYKTGYTAFRKTAGFWYAFGAVMFLWGLYAVLENSWIEILFLAASTGLMTLSARVRSTALLAVSIAATFCYITHFSAEHFADSIGWPVTLILLGIAFFGLGNIALKIRKKYMGA